MQMSFKIESFQACSIKLYTGVINAFHFNSSQIFVVKGKAYPQGSVLMGSILLPNIRIGWKCIKLAKKTRPGACTIKLFTAVIVAIS